MHIQVRPLTIGPIVGHTTHSTVRLWGKGNSDDRYGVVRVRLGELDFEIIRVFRLSEFHDHAGIIDLIGLAEGEGWYKFQMGILEGVTAIPIADVDAWINLHDLTWPTSIPEGQFRVFPADTNNKPIRFILGSCRDNLSNAGEPTFKAIDNHIDQIHPHFILMMGDQIYIDHMGIWGSYREKNYRNKYHKAFGKSNFAAVTGKLPTYTILDDHEIKNGWTAAKLAESTNMKDLHARNFGFRFYEAYQACLSPALAEGSTLSEQSFAGELADKHYWYSYQVADIPFFVLDVRTESQFTEEWDDAPILGPVQFQALKDWLVDPGHEDGQVKFVVCSLPLFPDECYLKERFNPKAEKWAGGRSQRRELLTFLHDNREKCRKVVFLSGDVHVSFLARAEFSYNGRKSDFWVNQVVSSAFHWASPGMQPGWFSDKNHLLMPYATQEPKVYIPYIKKIHQEDGFGEIIADKNSATFKVYRTRDSERKSKQESSYNLEFPPEIPV